MGNYERATAPATIAMGRLHSVRAFRPLPANAERTTREAINIQTTLPVIVQFHRSGCGQGGKGPATAGQVC